MKINDSILIGKGKSKLADMYKVNADDLDFIGATDLTGLEGYNDGELLLQYCLYCEGHERDGSTFGIQSSMLA